METELAPAICAIVKACVNGKASECTMRQIKNSIEKATRTIQVTIIQFLCVNVYAMHTWLDLDHC